MTDFGCEEWQVTWSKHPFVRSRHAQHCTGLMSSHGNLEDMIEEARSTVCAIIG